MSADHKLGLELRNGDDIGRDPRQMSGDELVALGHAPMSPLRALRLRCIDCSGGSANEVRFCTAVRCPAWPFRMGRNPWRAPRSEAQLAHIRTLASGMPRPAKKQPSLGAGKKFQRVPATTLPDDLDATRNLVPVERKSQGTRNDGDASLRHAGRVDGGVR
jgi:hypothetical protein